LSRRLGSVPGPRRHPGHAEGFGVKFLPARQVRRIGLIIPNTGRNEYTI
jgi:hypothetical protein